MKVSYQFDPEDAATKRMEKFVFGQWRSLSEMVAIGVMLFVLYGVSQAVLQLVATGWEGLPFQPVAGGLLLWVGITLGLVGAYLTLIFVSRYRDLVAERELELGAYRKGPVRVELTAEGVSTRAPGQARQIAWISVRGLIDTPLGLGLRLDERDFIPVPDDRLPDAMDRKALTSQINAWRGQGGGAG